LFNTNRCGLLKYILKRDEISIKINIIWINNESIYPKGSIVEVVLQVLYKIKKIS